MSGSHPDKEVLDPVLAFCSALETREVQLRSFCRHGVQVKAGSRANCLGFWMNERGKGKPRTFNGKRR